MTTHVSGQVPVALTIATSDPSGGAGIQADLKTFSALGAYGTAVLVALTAQNTRGVTGIHVLPTEFIAEQVDTLVSDVRVDAVKIGMLADATVVHTVAEALRRHRDRLPSVVLDPVMVASSGDRLLTEDAVALVRTELLPLAGLVTPNLPEAAALLGTSPARTPAEVERQAAELRALGVPRVLLKGGHGDDPEESADLYLDADGAEWLRAPRIHTRHTHGTGCTLSSAIAALRPQRPDWRTAVVGAKDYLTAALAAADSLDVGGGHGPVHHFHAWWGAR
ncbi:hydroxymethylpyrimidine/phosphomethylpyrimidine kinase [Actinopolymorpha cephalotaxi]|uniref:Hydroxymethylpyrimidine/phosphomethylpyrimidine kinase n=1 Tax=Actinopolymorpha cephalotaxi TaxID=504797 RepID=A0A1I3AGQ7_9ACTN|nr:bifunctional hydroxymethylpyrimidine kinase/phosphomethylpyrimidine kinase [Actinopolymorpha cephalotaxi]NYH82133.1 hydroxymethylpyrimidine/phosphomethylpyrimidine kinase [Actinopolymorpha cephalotaxi]SFH49195.1 hydroxymethylpyrimidine/phosphomethylpyrimidine kinase [Actinopolymorpha cephalotaxi]